MFIQIKSKFFNAIQKLTTVFTSFILLFNSLFINVNFVKANPSHITPDGTTNTIIDITPNNITIVNIADPNSNGISVNNFLDYNVDQTGVIINNSNVNYNTTLGSWISANTNISNGSNHEANLIVAQVTSNNLSDILGYTEIAGYKADFVLLNPNGIACNGCGFININNMFLTTGTASYQSGMLTGIDTNNNGSISINGSGLDGKSLNSLSLISKQLNFNAKTNLGNTGTLILQQGTGNFDFTNQQFTTVSTTQGNSVAIDASSLGSMYAGSIYIIANDLGAGVHLKAETIAQSQGVTIATNGDVIFDKTVAAKTDLSIIAKTITNNQNSILFSQNDTFLKADIITNSSIVLARNDISINATTLNNGSTTQAAYINAGNNMQIIANQINNIGKDNQSLIEGDAYQTHYIYDYSWTYVNDPPKIVSQEVVDNRLTSANSRIIANNNLVIQGNLLNQTGDILAGKDMTIIGNVTNNITHYTTRPIAANWYHRYEDYCVGDWCHVEHDRWTAYSTQTLSSTTPTRIAAGGNLTIIGNKISNDSGNATFNSNTPLTQNISPNLNNNYASTFNNAANLNTTNPNAPTLNLSDLASSGLFQNNTNPPTLTTTNLSGTRIDFTYQTETNPAFTNQNIFLSSEYFLQHLNYSPSRQINFIGDPTYERQLIHDTIAKTGMVQYLSDKAEDDLYKQGLFYLQNNPDYAFGDPLTPDQINNLTKDMIIPVFIDGVLTPQIYFCNQTLQNNQQQNQTGGQIYSNNGSTTIVAMGADADITNKGYISSKTGTNIISQGSFTNEGGTINSTTGDININAKKVTITTQSYTSDITERHLEFISYVDNNNNNNNTNITNGDSNSGQVYNTQVILGLPFLSDPTKVGTSTQIQNVSKLTANNGNINITSSDDLNIESAYIKALNNVNLKSDNGDVNIVSDKSISNLALNTKITYINNQSKAIGSQIVSDGDLNINAKNNINIIAEANTDYTYYHFSSDDFFNKISTTSESSSVQNIAQQLNANNVNLNANSGKTNIYASDITATNDVNIDTKQDISILAGKNSDYSMHESSSSTMLFWADQNIKSDHKETNAASNIKAGNNVKINSQEGNVVILASNIDTTNNIDINSKNTLITSNELTEQHMQASMSMNFDETRVTQDASLSVTNEESKLTANNISINAIQDIVIKSSDLKAIGDIFLNAGNDLTIASAVDTYQTMHYESVTRNPLLNILLNTFFFGIIKVRNSLIENFANPSFESNKTILTDEQNSESSLTATNINIDTNDTTIQGSKLFANNNISIDSDGNIIISAQELTDTSIHENEKKWVDPLTILINLVIRPAVGGATGAAAGATTGALFGGSAGATVGAWEGFLAGVIDGLIATVIEMGNEDNLKYRIVTDTLKETSYEGSLLLANNNIDLASKQDTTLIGSDLKAQDTITIDTNGNNFNQLSTNDHTTTTREVQEGNPDYGKIAENAAKEAAISGAISGATAGVLSTLTQGTNLAKESAEIIAKVEKYTPQVIQNAARMAVDYVPDAVKIVGGMVDDVVGLTAKIAENIGRSADNVISSIANITDDLANNINNIKTEVDQIDNLLKATVDMQKKFSSMLMQVNGKAIGDDVAKVIMDGAKEMNDTIDDLTTKVGKLIKKFEAYTGPHQQIQDSLFGKFLQMGQVLDKFKPFDVNLTHKGIETIINSNFTDTLVAISQAEVAFNVDSSIESNTKQGTENKGSVEGGVVIIK